MSTNGKMESITKASLSESISEVVPDISHKDCGRLVDSIVRTIRETLSRGEEVKISGFGKFTLHEKKSRRGRNPQTGNEITIAARRVLKFKPSDVLRERLNDVTPGEG
jgi:integration host factor subunit alpha